MRVLFISWLVFCACAATGALAGPNADGVILLHAEAALQYSVGADYCNTSVLTNCESAVVSVPGGTTDATVFFLVASFPAEGSSRLLGATFGVTYESARFELVDHGSCADFELPDSNWPASGAGTALTWSSPQTAAMTELYWFAGYATYEPAVFSVTGHPVHGATFGDDAIPAAIDIVAGFGSLGFGTEGVLPCPPTGDSSEDGPGGSEDGPFGGEESGQDRNGPRPESGQGGREVLIIGPEDRWLEVYTLGNAAMQCGVSPIPETLEQIRLWWPGDPDTIAIQKEIRYWFEGTNLLNKNVLLFGRWTRQEEFPQYRDVPTRYIEVGDLAPNRGTSATDQLYGDFDLDGVWDVPVWRLATNNAAETGAFCAKVATYNNGIGDVEWTRHIEFHCEDRNIVGGASPDRARELSLSLASQVSGAFVNDGVIFSSERSDATRPLVLPEALTAGKAVIVAGPSVAASSNRWLNFTPYGFRFNQGPANQRYPLMIGGSCELGSYQVYYEAGDEWCPVARDWLHITNSAQGPISWIGPTAGSHQYVNYWILEELLEHLTMNGADFGHALLMATRSVYYAHPEAYEAVVTYAGIGAPWLSLHRATGDPADAPIAIATDLNVPEFRIVPNPTYRPHGVEIQLVGRPLSQWGGLVVGPDGRRLLEFSVRDADRFSWDLRDRAGNAVPSGVYFVRGSGNLAGQGARIIVVR